LVLFTLVFVLAACSVPNAGAGGAPSTPLPVDEVGEVNGAPSSVAQPTVEATDPLPEATLEPIDVAYDEEDLQTDTEGPVTATIEMDGDTVTVEGLGVTVDVSRVVISAAGTYSLHGVLNEGRIVVDAADEDEVVLLLNGVEITCSTGAPIYVLNAEKTIITLASGTENTVTDGDGFVLEEGSDEPNAAIFSHDDLTINGDGALTVNAHYHAGIVSKDDLKITGGMLTVNALNDGIKGRDSLVIKDGAIVVNAEGDGLETSNDEEAEEGTIVIEGGTLTVVAGLDGIQAATRLQVDGGTLTITSGGGSANASDRAGWGTWGSGVGDDAADSAKGLKAGADLTITNGILTVDASDDALHSNGSLTVAGGQIRLASGDDGIHADATLTIDGGALEITKSYEGIESAVITINDGTVRLVASDDGINVSGGSDGSALAGRPGQNTFAAFSGTDHLYVNGGTVTVDAGGDGIDANSPIDMTGGTVIINGPTDNANGPIDYMGEFRVTGGFLVAAGSAGMAQAPSASSTQNSVLVVFPTSLPAGTLVHIASDDGDAVLTFLPTKAYQSVVLSSPDLVQGATYTVYTGGSATGTAVDGLTTGGTTTTGTPSTEFTVTSVTTFAGSYRGGFPGGGPGARPGRPGGQRP